MIPLTKKEEKLIASLQQNKYRKSSGLFFVEGIKMVEEALKSSFVVDYIVTVEDFNHEVVKVKQCDDITMQRISAFKTAPGLLAVIQLPKEQKLVDSDITVVAEKIQDPGNFGTIIRTAEALGVKQIVCSLDSVDHFSPKVVQASMGSIFRMSVLSTDLIAFLEATSINTIYAAHLSGNNLYQENIKTPCILLVGNESKGLSNQLMKFVSNPVKIPMLGNAESFNVSIATAIILSEFRRQIT